MSDGLHCSFCGKSQYSVRKLIAGPAVVICDECVALCQLIIEEGAATPVARRMTKRLGGFQRAQIRLQAFAALKGWGSTGPDGKWQSWGFDALCAKAEELAEWALAEPLSIVASAEASGSIAEESPATHNHGEAL